MRTLLPARTTAKFRVEFGQRARLVALIGEGARYRRIVFVVLAAAFQCLGDGLLAVGDCLRCSSHFTGTNAEVRNSRSICAELSPQEVASMPGKCEVGFALRRVALACRPIAGNNAAKVTALARGADRPPRPDRQSDPWCPLRYRCWTDAAMLVVALAEYVVV